MKKNENRDITLSYKEIEEFIDAVNNNKLDIIMPYLQMVARSLETRLENAEKSYKKAIDCKHEWVNHGSIEPYYTCCKLCGLQYRAFKEGRPKANWKHDWTHTINI